MTFDPEGDLKVARLAHAQAVERAAFARLVRARNRLAAEIQERGERWPADQLAAATAILNAADADIRAAEAEDNAQPAF